MLVNENIHRVAPGRKDIQDSNDNKTCEDAANGDRIDSQDIHVANQNKSETRAVISFLWRTYQLRTDLKMAR